MLSVDFGRQRRPNDTIEYIVQVDPETFADMQATGRSIGSALPPNLRSRIGELTFRVGREPLPNQNTLPPETVEPKLIDAAGDDLQPIQQTAGYQPPGPPGGDTSWASQNPTATRWPSSQSNVPSTGVPATNTGPTTSAWPSSSSAAARYGDNVQLPPPPTSTSGFPINPNATPPATNAPTNTTFPGSTLGTLPPSTSIPTPTSGSAAWPTSTAPPSLSSGPRMTQPSPWSAPPREVSITARMPAETTSTTPTSPTTGPLPGTPTVPTAPPNYAYNAPPAGYYPSNYYPQPTAPQYAQAGYPPQGQQPPGMQPMQPQPGQQYAQQPGTPVAGREPASPHPTMPAATTSANTAAESNGLMWALAVIGLMTSLACNFYFGWSTYQIRERYRLLLVDRNAYST
jgi:hypothetical protein